MNQELLDMKKKLHLISEVDFKVWSDKYRAKVREKAEWSNEDFLLFKEIGALKMVCKTVSFGVSNQPNFAESFFSFFTSQRLSEMAGTEIPSNTAVNLH